MSQLRPNLPRPPGFRPLFVLPLVLFTVAACGSGDSADPVDPGDPDPPSDPDPETAVVAGQIIHGGAGVGSVEILLTGGPGADRQDTTPNNGRFEFRDLEPGSWTLEVTPPGYFELAPDESASRSVTATGGSTTTVEVTLSPLIAGEPMEIDLTGNLTFVPSNATVTPGTLIRWVNVANVFHTITPDNQSEWNRGTVDATGDTFEAVVNNPGSFDYFCEPHVSQGMRGVISVEL